MRFHRTVYLFGWTAVVLLAIAGLAAFSTGRQLPPSTGAGAARSYGAAAGAVAAQGVLALAGEQAPAPAAASLDPIPDPTPAGASVTRTTARSDTATSRITGWLSSVEVRDLVTRYFLPSDINRAVRVAWCASRFDPDAVNPQTGAAGLFQLDPDDFAALNDDSAAGVLDPELNAAAAARIVYEGDGWEAFGACRG